MTAPELVTFRARDGVRLEGILQTPPAGGSFPAAAIAHSHSLRDGGHMHAHILRAVAAALARSGIAALRLNFRGVQGSAGSFDDGRGELHDLRGALDFLESRRGVDARRLALVGYSFGARVAVPCALADPRVKAVATLGLPARRYPEPIDLRVPALLLVGGNDATTPPHHVERFHARQPTTTLRVLAETDHYYRGCEEEVADEVAQFLLAHL